MRFEQEDLVLEDTALFDRFGRVGLEDLPDPEPRNPTRLGSAATPMMQRLWKIALFDIESNIVEHESGSYFGAGDHFGLRVYTRDICLSGVLGLNVLYPTLMRDSIDYTRKLRRELGFLVGEPYVVEQIDVPWQVSDLSGKQFLQRHRTNNYMRRTDDVVWLWAAGQLADQFGDADYTRKVYQTGKEFFERFYEPFREAETGLYRGQACFIDVAWPGGTSSGYPKSYDVADCVLLQATSTNCLYVLGMRVMAGLARALGQEGEASVWLSRARQLTEAIGAHLRGPDGKLMYYRDRNGELSDRREALGLGLAVLSGVVQGEDAVTQVDYPVTTAGAPLIWPFYEDDRMYHNNSSWPFVDAFFLWGAQEATGADRKGQAAALLGRTTAIDGSFHELVDMRDGSIGGSGRQLWSAAGFVNVCLRDGLVQQVHRDV